MKYLKSKAHIITLLGILFSSQIHAQWQSFWQPLSTGLQHSFAFGMGSCLAMTTYNGKLIVGGNFTSAGGNVNYNNIAAWDGTNWSNLGSTGLNTPNLLDAAANLSKCSYYNENSIGPWVGAMLVYNNELYAAGSFTRADGLPVNNIAKWNGSAWSDVGGGVQISNPNPTLQLKPYIHGMIVYQNELYVTGAFNQAGATTALNIAKWNGANWSAVGGGLDTTLLWDHGEVMTIYNNKLVVGGAFTTAGNVAVNNIAEWNGSTWSAMGPGIPANQTQYAGVTDLGVHNNILYAGNISTGISAWNGSSWSTVGGGLSAAAFTNLSTTQGLIAGGAFGAAGNTQNVGGIAIYNGVNWNHLYVSCLSNYSGLGCINALCFYNGFLYAGGDFNSEICNPNVPLRKIARLISPLSLSENVINESNLKIYPSPAQSEISLDDIFTNTKVEIYDMQGINVFSGIYQNSIDVSSFASGIYLLAVEMDGYRKTNRFMILR